MNYSTSDGVGNPAAAMTTVEVLDTTDPTIVCPSNVTVPMTSVFGTPVSFPDPIATDNDAPLMVSCSLSSGDLFGRGATTVNCTASDPSSNASACAFDVIVQSPEDLVLAKLGELQTLRSGISDASTVKDLDKAQKHYDKALKELGKGKFGKAWKELS